MSGGAAAGGAGKPTRRQFLRMLELGGLAAGGAGLLAGHGSTVADAAGSGTLHLNFWDMQWGQLTYNQVGAQLVAEWNKAHPKVRVSYTPIAWSNSAEKFATAVSSGTNPNFGSDGAYQPFQYLAQGFGTYTDEVISALKKSGALSDFYPSAIDWMKYKGHYAALPWQIDCRAVYYRKSLLEKVDQSPPKNWQDILTIGKALKKQGIFGFGMSGTTADSGGWQVVMCMILNNNGGLFAKDGTIDCVTDANIQTVEFLQELASEKIIDPAAPGYESTEITKQFGAGQLALTWSTTNMPPSSLPSNVIGDTGIISHPILSPTGHKGGIFWVNPVMIYKHQSGADLKGSEEFLTWYMTHTSLYWEKNSLDAVPVRKSVAGLKVVTDNPYIAIPTNNWLPYGKHTGNFYPHIVPALNTVESAPPLYNFAEQIVEQPTTSAKTLLSTLQSALQSTLGKDTLA